jgi:cell division protein ZapA (FtsZ GTPase activity inhibitor)
MTAKQKHVVRVTILGEEYQIRSDAPAEHTRAVAKYLDDAVRGVMGNALAVDSHKAAILAALQITGELFQVRQTAADATAALGALDEDARRWLPPARRGDGTA